jgi:hypothetical protein
MPIRPESRCGGWGEVNGDSPGCGKRDQMRSARGKLRDGIGTLQTMLKSQKLVVTSCSREAGKSSS